MTLIGILAMRWNVVIGGQLFSKSFLGYTTYKMGFATREGLLPAILIMMLPFVILADPAAPPAAVAVGARRQGVTGRDRQGGCARRTRRGTHRRQRRTRRAAIMNEDQPRLEVRLRKIDEALSVLCQRVTALERIEPSHAEAAMHPPHASADDVVSVRAATLPSSPSTWSGPAVLSLIGRTFVILGGAYLLRALTESGSVPQSSGIVLGFAYASVWIGAADRAAVQRPASGLFHGLAGLIIGVALLWKPRRGSDSSRRGGAPRCWVC